MGWICYRRATEEDYVRLDERARAFAKRHQIEGAVAEMTWGYSEREMAESGAYYGGLVGALECHTRPGVSDVEAYDWGYLRQLWRQIFRRAVDSHRATGIAWGHIGRDGE